MSPVCEGFHAYITSKSFNILMNDFNVCFKFGFTRKYLQTSCAWIGTARRGVRWEPAQWRVRRGSLLELLHLWFYDDCTRYPCLLFHAYLYRSDCFLLWQLRCCCYYLTVTGRNGFSEVVSYTFLNVLACHPFVNLKAGWDDLAFYNIFKNTEDTSALITTLSIIRFYYSVSHPTRQLLETKS